MKDKSVNTTVQIIDRAVPATNKSLPKIRRKMMNAGLASLMISVFLAYYLEKQGKRSSLF